MQIYKVHVPLLHLYLTLWLFILGFLILVVSFKILILLWRVNVTSLLTPPSYKHISVKITSTEVKKTGKTCQWEQILPVFNLLLFGFRVLSVLIPIPNWSEETMRFWFTFRTDFTHNIQMLAYHIFLLFCSQTRKTVNTRNISGMLLCSKKIANQAWEN